MIIAVIGLGYVGAPLAIELAKHHTVIGFDINVHRIDELRGSYDSTGELSREVLRETTAKFTFKRDDIHPADVYIITVPTPVAEGNVPDLSAVKKATELVADYLSFGDTVIYESTVYPGVTEDICVPILEKKSGFRWKQSFFVAYSPERINPGDKVHTLTTTTKIVSGDCEETLDFVDFIYSSITQTYRASSIKVAEAAKVIENTQRDVNIALVNELAQIFTRMDIDTNDVIDAAASKWNFQPFRPGLVGGHCISIDPYYLSHKAATTGFIADVILSAREVNDSMAAFVVDQLIKQMSICRLLGDDPVVTILGATFKENVPDIRNSKVFDIVEALIKYGIEAQVVDPLADAELVHHEYGVRPTNYPKLADAVILAVPHEQFVLNGWDGVLEYCKKSQDVVVMDLKGALNRDEQPEGTVHWRP